MNETPPFVSDDISPEEDASSDTKNGGLPNPLCCDNSMFLVSNKDCEVLVADIHTIKDQLYKLKVKLANTNKKNSILDLKDEIKVSISSMEKAAQRLHNVLQHQSKNNKDEVNLID